MTKTIDCICGKPTGVLSRWVGTTLYHQVICSDSSCPLLDTFDTAEEAAKVYNDLMEAFIRDCVDKWAC